MASEIVPSIMDDACMASFWSVVGFLFTHDQEGLSLPTIIYILRSMSACANAYITSNLKPSAETISFRAVCVFLSVSIHSL